MSRPKRQFMCNWPKEKMKQIRNPQQPRMNRLGQSWISWDDIEDPTITGNP